MPASYHRRLRVAVGQFEGIDATPALPLAAGCLIAVATRDLPLADWQRAFRYAHLAWVKARLDIGDLSPELPGTVS